MSKYICNTCQTPAYSIDLASPLSGVSSVYAYCETCRIEAWGGRYFHPEMNDLFNKLFEPNLKSTESTILELYKI